MSNRIHTRRVVPAVLAVIAIAGVAAIGCSLLVSHRSAPPGAVNAAPSPTPSPFPTPSGAVALIHGARLADGIEIGYPHTTIGAISAAAEYLDAAVSTLDPDYAASVMRTAGDPADSDLPDALAASALKLRADLRLPTDGPIDPPTAFLTTAQMYQLRDDAPDSVLVLLLTTNTYIAPNGGTAQTTGVFPVRMRWTGGDWKLNDIGDTTQDYSDLDAAPGTQAAADHGWLALIPATGGGS